MEGKESRSRVERKRLLPPLWTAFAFTHRIVATDQVLKQLRAQLQEYKDHLRALESGESYTPKLTAVAISKKSKAGGYDEDESSDSDSDSDSGSSRGKKRKNKSGDKQGSSKKRRKCGDGDDDDDDFIVDDDVELVFSDSDTASDRASNKGNGPDSSSDVEDDEDEDKEEEEDEEEDTEMATEESLKVKIQELEDSLKQGRADLAEYRRLRKEAMDAIASSKKKQVRVQREKNAFCSLKRSEVEFPL